jgi:hypothetical protein
MTRRMVGIGAGCQDSQGGVIFQGSDTKNQDLEPVVLRVTVTFLPVGCGSVRWRNLLPDRTHPNSAAQGTLSGSGATGATVTK